MPLIDFEHFGLRDRIAHLCHLWLEVPLKTVRFYSKKRGNFYFIFRSVDTLTAHIVLFSQNKKIKPTCSSFIFFFPLQDS